MAEHEAGTLLGGKFVIEGVLGRGGMGVVYAARHASLDQRVAIKCLLPEAMAIPAVVERFAREARAAAKIQGEHVTRVLDVGADQDGTPFIVMEYMQGHDLADELMLQGVIAIPDAVRYVLQACEAIAQAHALRIVHRDLKPSNLFLAETPGRRPVIKVLDFGISKMLEPGGTSLTKTTSMMGTPFYMSPEQLLSAKTVDERSDIWALGIILYELLTGAPPFAAETGPEIIAQIVRNTPRLPRDMRPEIPVELEGVILRCLRSKPDERFPDVGELAIALGPFAEAVDRESVQAISRVLGDSGQMARAGSIVPSMTRPPPVDGTVHSPPAFAATINDEPTPRRAKPTVNRLVDVVAESPRRSGSRIVAVVLAVALVDVLGAVITLRGRTAPVSAPGARPSEHDTTSAPGSLVAAPPPTGTALAPPEATASTADSGGAAPRAPEQTPVRGPRTQPKAQPIASAAILPRPLSPPSSSIAPPPPATPPVDSVAKPPPPVNHPPPASKNPLDIQLQ